jgi:hypothetical protein
MDRSAGELLCNRAKTKLTVFRGHEIKALGDGVLATFDGPRARSARKSKASESDVRIGLRTSECELLEKTSA